MRAAGTDHRTARSTTAARPAARSGGRPRMCPPLRHRRARVQAKRVPPPARPRRSGAHLDPAAVAATPRRVAGRSIPCACRRRAAPPRSIDTARPRRRSPPKPTPRPPRPAPWSRRPGAAPGFLQPTPPAAPARRAHFPHRYAAVPLDVPPTGAALHNASGAMIPRCRPRASWCASGYLNRRELRILTAQHLRFFQSRRPSACG